MNHKEIFKNASFQAISRVVTTAVGFIITILIASYFGVSGYGDFIKITSFVSLFYLLVDFGLNANFLKKPKSFSTLLLTRILISVVLIFILNIVASLLPYDSTQDVGFSAVSRFGILIYSFILVFQAVIFSTSAVFQRKLKYNFFLISQTIGASVNILLISILVFFTKSLNLILLAFVISAAITSLVSLYLSREEISGFDKSFSKQLLISSIPLGLMLAFNLIYFRIDIFLLSIFRNTKEVGIYGLSYKFFDFFIALPLFLSNALYPKILNDIKNKEKFYKTLKFYFLVFLLLPFLIIVPVWFLSPLFGLIKPEFAEAKIPFRILILSLPLFFLTSFFQWVLISMKEQKYLVYVYFFATLINIVLNILLIPKYSYIGAAATTGVGELIILVLLIFKFRKVEFFPKGAKSVSNI